MKQNPWSNVLLISGILLDVSAFAGFILWVHYLTRSYRSEFSFIPLAGILFSVLLSFLLFAIRSGLKDLRAVLTLWDGNQPANQPTNQPTNQLTNQSINQPINQARINWVQYYLYKFFKK